MTEPAELDFGTVSPARPWWGNPALQAVDPPLSMVLIGPDEDRHVRTCWPEAVDPGDPGRLFGLARLIVPRLRSPLPISGDRLAELANLIGAYEGDVLRAGIEVVMRGNEGVRF